MSLIGTALSWKLEGLAPRLRRGGGTHRVALLSWAGTPVPRGDQMDLLCPGSAGMEVIGGAWL